MNNAYTAIVAATGNRSDKRKWRATGARIEPEFHLKPNAAWRARKRWNRENRNKPPTYRKGRRRR